MSESDPIREKWNRRHAESVANAKEAVANPWIADHQALLSSHAPGRALDVACGLGGNAFLLASVGFSVQAVDVSDVAIAEVNRQAEARGAAVSATCRDLEADGLPPGSWDVIVELRYLQRSLFPSLAEALAPGGILVVETFLRGHRGRGGKPFNPDYTLEPGELEVAFAELEVVDYREAVDGRRALAGIVARRAG